MESQSNGNRQQLVEQDQPDQDQQERRPGTTVTAPSAVSLSEMAPREQDGHEMSELRSRRINQYGLI